LVPTPLIIAHRGSSSVAPENTIAAFQRAIADGADGIEFDVRLSRDHVPVVIHDACLQRTALRPELVRDLSAAELRSVDVGSWFSLSGKDAQAYSEVTIPILSDVLDLFDDVDAVLYLEMKCERGAAAKLASAIAQAIRGRSIAERIVIECFELAALGEIRDRDPHLRTAALFEPKLRQPLSILRAQGLIKLAREWKVDEVALHHKLARRNLIKQAIQNDLKVAVWTVDSPDWINRSLALGISAVITNDPAAMLHCRDRSK